MTQLETDILVTAALIGLFMTGSQAPPRHSVPRK
jgi:hypothetical protein